MIFEADRRVVVPAGMTIPDGCEIGHGTIIGYGGDGAPPQIGHSVKIGAFCVIHNDSSIGERVSIDHYCRVGTAARIGADTRILYGSQLFDDCTVGQRCIIGGNISDRVLVEDDVTFMGAIAHSHRDASLDWDDTEEPSPIFRRGCVIGVEALIIGGITIGEGSYVGAREVVRTDVPARTVVLNGARTPIEKWRGFIKSRL